MHEVSIAQEIISIAESCFAHGNCFSVQSVRVEIGEFSNIMIEPLEFAFNILIKESRMPDAKLIIKHIPLSIKCHDCWKISYLNEPFFYCAECESSHVEILTGTEMKVTEIEIEETMEPV